MVLLSAPDVSGDRAAVISIAEEEAIAATNEKLSWLGSGGFADTREVCFVARKPLSDQNRAVLTRRLVDLFSSFAPQVHWESWQPDTQGEAEPDSADSHYATAQSNWFNSDEMWNGVPFSENSLEVCCERKPGFDIDEFDLLVRRALRSTDAFYLRLRPFRAGHSLVAQLFPARLLTDVERVAASRAAADWFEGHDVEFTWFMTPDAEVF